MAEHDERVSANGRANRATRVSARARRRRQRYSISGLAREFDVTPRTIRYYEECGLLQPERRGQQRVYLQRDRVRLRLILRGRRLGFGLSEIGEMVDLHAAGTGERRQLERMLEHGRTKIAELRARRDELDATLQELLSWQERLTVVLAEMESGGP